MTTMLRTAMARPLAVKGIAPILPIQALSTSEAIGSAARAKKAGRAIVMMLSLMLRLLWSCVRAGADEGLHEGQIWPARSLAFAPPAKAPARRRQTGEIQHTSGRKSFSFVFFSFFTETLPLPPLVPPALARRNRGPCPRLRTKTPGTRLRAALGAPEPLTGDQGGGRVSQACPTPGPALVDAAALSVRRAEAWAAMVVMAHLRPAQRTLASPNARSSYICFRAQSFRRLSLLCVERDSPCSDSSSG